MKLSELKPILNTVQTVAFVLPNGIYIPEHSHVTEIGLITRNFIDCGGTVRKETVINFQLWSDNDLEHRLQPSKLQDIIALSEKVLGIEDFEIEVEYQSETIGKYDLGFNGTAFTLRNKQTACLALEACGSTSGQQKESTADSNLETNACTPGGNCC